MKISEKYFSSIFYKKINDMKKDDITVNNLLKVEKEISENTVYGQENKLITNCFNNFPKNADILSVSIKIGIIDITNSTNISRYKSKISVVELAQHIVNIPDLDKMIINGEPRAVELIAKANNKINLFSFASKYCCYHNCNVYQKDDYSIYDTIIAKHLPEYFDDISYNTFNTWRKNCNYSAFNNYIKEKLDVLGINLPNRRRMFDYFIWYKNRKR